ncbi:MAG TPA: chromosomal replication initiator protein DnaA [Candidatus Omnitrophota bacterium]|nr:chromosomal replication initiator protein DnaA [Candidatus Omnitrophota bacterium]
MSLISVWNTAQNHIKEKAGETSYETWFTTLHAKEKDAQTLIIETPDEFFKNWVVDHYHQLIEEAMRLSGGDGFTIEYIVNSYILKNGTQSRLNEFEKKFSRDPSSKYNLNSRFTFENFVVGPSNRFACAASLAVAEAPAKAYNPLLIYGAVGLGKTHLIQAITHKIRELHPESKHCYLTSEQFTNELIDSIRHQTTSQFRKKYRDIDVLLIDDIQFIAGKESTQEEFFHTFNNLHGNRKQIIITSDRPPRDITNLEERLRSRFAWGLITDIQPPDFETRVAILRKKMAAEPVSVPDEIVFFIAEQIKTNIRELEGALIRVVAYALLEDKLMTLEMAKMVLKDMVKETSNNISIDVVQKSVASFFNIPLSEMRAKRRTKNIVVPRQIAMYLSRQLTNRSLPEIGNAFGGKDHTTVLHSCKKIETEISESGEMKNLIDRLTITIKQ